MSRLGSILAFMAVVSLMSFVIVRSLLGVWVPFLWVALGMFSFFVGSMIYVDRKNFKEFVSMKTTKNGFSMGTVILMTTLLLAVVNYFGAKHFKIWDFSSSKINSLSEQSAQLLRGLKGDLKVMYFFKNNAEGVETTRAVFLDLIRKYQDKSDLVKLEFIEINQNPDLAEKYGITKATQSVVLEYQGRTAQIEKLDEQELTAGIVKLTREKTKSIYFLTGHGELEFESSQDGESIAFLKQILEGGRYTVKALDLREGNFPKDADVVMIIGPQQPLLAIEIEILEDYLKTGGNLFLALEPKAKHGLAPMLSKLGLKLADNYVLSVNRVAGEMRFDPQFTFGSIFSETNLIMRPFNGSNSIVFRTPQGILRESANPPEGLEIDDLVKSNQNSVSVQSAQSEKPDGEGPFTIVEFVKGSYPGLKSAPSFQLIVAGDRQFLNDATLYQYQNRDLMMNSVSALAKEESLISIAPKEVSRTQVMILSSQFTMFVLSFVGITLALYVGSGVVWWRRRYS